MPKISVRYKYTFGHKFSEVVLTYNKHDTISAYYGEAAKVNLEKNFTTILTFTTNISVIKLETRAYKVVVFRWKSSTPETAWRYTEKLVKFLTETYIRPCRENLRALKKLEGSNAKEDLIDPSQLAIIGTGQKSML